MIFWATAAIVNAIWASTGEVDVWSLLQVLVTVFCLMQLSRAEKRHEARP